MPVRITNVVNQDATLISRRAWADPHDPINEDQQEERDDQQVTQQVREDLVHVSHLLT